MADVPANKLRCVVVTPERSVLDEIVDAVVVPAYDGELGVLPGRLALVARLGAGELRMTSGSKTTSYFISGGFVQVRANVVTLLTTQAVARQLLDRNKAQAALNTAVADTSGTPEERAARADSARAMVRLAAR